MTPGEREHDELAARRELGPEMDDELVELFLARVDRHITSRAVSQVAHRRTHIRNRDGSRADLPGILRSRNTWRSVLLLAAFLLACAIVFGADVSALTPIAAVILLTVFLSHRSYHGNRPARHL